MKYPVLIYDNLCTSCTKYAQHVHCIVRGKITILGHYTIKGKEFTQKIFPEGYEGTDMSWFVTESIAYGGRKGLIQLIKYVFSKKEGVYPTNHFDISECTTDCRTMKGLTIRSCSILTEGKIIPLT